MKTLELFLSRIDIKRLSILFAVLLLFQAALTYINNRSVEGFIQNTAEWYKKDSAERLANITVTSLEMIIERIKTEDIENDIERKGIIQAFNVILGQQLLKEQVRKICIIVEKDEKLNYVEDGENLFNVLYGNIEIDNRAGYETISLYNTTRSRLKSDERISTAAGSDNDLKIFVPFVPKGKYIGSLYMEFTPDFSLIREKIAAGYDNIGSVYFYLIIIGFIGMYYISSRTIRERDDAQKLLFEETRKNLTEQLKFQEEALFSKRIYHAHHKAEKIMGFIKSDIMGIGNSETKERILKYSNFISRVIYDMKSYSPPVQSIRSDMFSSDINKIIRFLTENIFLRSTGESSRLKFLLKLQDDFPLLNVNEYVIWEILEPLIQNCIDHSGKDTTIIEISTSVASGDKGIILISDSGVGIAEEMLEEIGGIKKMFQEYTSTKNSEGRNRGYGCFLAYTIAGRCGWNLDARNKPDGGAMFVIKVDLRRAGASK